MKIKLWLGTFLMVMLFAGTAMAEVYEVKKGDTLSRIAGHYGVTARDIQAVNSQIKNINRIEIGWKLTIPAKQSQTVVIGKKNQVKSLKPVKIKKSGRIKLQKSSAVDLPPMDIYVHGESGIRQGNYSKPGGDPTRMTNDKAFGKLRLNDDVKIRLSAAILAKAGVESFVKPGDQFLMTHGFDGVMDATLTYDGSLAATQYLVEDSNGIIHDVRYILWCHNWVRYPELPPKEKVAPPSVMIPPETEIPPQEEISLEVTPFEYIPAPKKHWTVEHEPILGAFYLGNDLGESQGIYGEYVLWFRKGECYVFENGWSPGIGIYGIYSEFDSKVGSYKGREGGIGPQAGIKYIGYGANPFNFQLKGRLIWEEMSGGTAEGYHMEQDGLKAGIYTEATKQIDEKFLVGVIGEYWWDLSSSRTSTWSGDTPSERGMSSLDVFGQMKINEDWGVRASAGVFNQTWDDLTGIHARLEARWKNTVMFGPYAAWYPFGLSDAYEGFSASDLTSYGAFVRVEFGEPIRKHYAKKRMKKVEAADREWLDDLLRTKFAQ
ncbi:MAG: LysM peptidoglycan-binding domain-containing protein [Candidatus Moranbacteria bacterium]|nr:LysM peptidoglycan-binding domain-containing protein [Candidatus Moranbacteria bacterium]